TTSHITLYSFLFLLFRLLSYLFLSSTAPSPTEIYTLSLPRRSSDLQDRHVFCRQRHEQADRDDKQSPGRLHDDGGESRDRLRPRSEEHTSELQSPCNLVCRLLLEKKKR